jgi:MoaA/NifB/PqqE/SkfB family radical SAM enzyme
MQVFPNIPAILPAKEQVPAGYALMIHKWSYPAHRVGETVTIGGERVNKLLTIDLNIPREDFAAAVNVLPAGSAEAKKAFVTNYPCPHSCPGCYNNAELANPIMTLKEVMAVVDQAMELGLESMKFLGPGELLANPDLFFILDELAKRNIVAGIFTKAAIMGSDTLARLYHGIDAETLVSRLTSYPNTTFLVGARSFDPDRENDYIPVNLRELRGKFGDKFDLRKFRDEFNYHGVRNLAIERLSARGMNTDLARLRMAIICSPVTADNLDGAFEMYQWGTERNMPVYLPPTMVSGKGHRLVKRAADIKFENDYIALAAQVYVWAIERGVMTLERLQNEGPHPYIGVAPCNQLTFGLYLHYDGQVWRCPGNDTPEYIVHKNVRDARLKDIWMQSANYSIQKFNNRCVKDGISLPERFYDEVLERVAARVH